jgi:hypothetical protein
MGLGVSVWSVASPGTPRKTEAATMAGEDADFHRRDLREAIAGGDAPSWTFFVQVMPFADAADYRFNPFDLTKVWPKGDYPLIEVVVVTVDVLVFIDEQEAQAGEQAVAQDGGADAVTRARILFGSAQAPGRLADHFAEVHRLATLDRNRVAGAGEAHREPVQRLHRDAGRVGADQRPQAAADFAGGGAVVCEHHDRFGQHHAFAQEPGDAMHDDLGLPGARAGEHEVIAFERCGDDGLLLRVGEVGEDAAVRGLGGPLSRW